MRLKNKRILTYFGWVLLGIVVIFLVIQALLHFGVITSALKGCVSSLWSIIIGAILAYLFYPLTKIAEQFLLQHKVKKKPARTLSSFFAMFIFLLLIVLFVYIVVPQLVAILPPLMQNLPSMIDSFSDQVTTFLSAHGISSDIVENLFERIENFFTGWFDDDFLSALMEIVGKVKNAAQGLLNFIIGIIVMIYILMGRDQFVGQGKKILYATIKKRSTCDAILRHLRNINKIFSGFVSGKLLDSFIIGVICYIALSILKMPYTPLISVIVGVTNIIPFFGPFIGAIPSALLLLVTDPGKCVIFLIFVVILQQVDGNIIGPKILGDSTGLSAFWVLFSLLLFKHIMGFWGLLLGVPLFASFYYLFREFINAKLRKKELPEATDEYIHVVGISPAGVISYADPEHIEFPTLLRGENSLLNRLRQKLNKEQAQSEDENEPPEPPAE